MGFFTGSAPIARGAKDRETIAKQTTTRNISDPDPSCVKALIVVTS
jgi:hypothetical protein